MVFADEDEIVPSGYRVAGISQSSADERENAVGQQFHKYTEPFD